ncbi:aspartate 1-decarboxylase [Bradyrhizobium yuanmingense]|uniref:aspartate 1-decarboxylase n=1 Tax=Bradyrhizobium yuanmingense TaxID=108015 RepID=UPI003D2F2D59
MAFVKIRNKSSGARMSTCVIVSSRGSFCCALNAAVARIGQSRDPIVCCLSFLDEQQMAQFRPKTLTFIRSSQTSDHLTCSITSNAVDSYDFETVGELSDSSRFVTSAPIKIELRSK